MNRQHFTEQVARIRKPRALLDLIQLIADLPASVAPIKTDGVIA